MWCHLPQFFLRGLMHILPAIGYELFAETIPNCRSIAECYFVVTVHPGIILVSNQLEAQFFFLMCLFKCFTCFEQPRARHQEIQLYQYDIFYMSLCVGDRLVHRSGRKSFLTCIPDGHLHRVTYNILY